MNRIAKAGPQVHIVPYFVDPSESGLDRAGKIGFVITRR
jgi:hypothetical protein